LDANRAAEEAGRTWRRGRSSSLRLLCDFSATLTAAEWDGSRIARGDLAEEISALKNKPGGDGTAIHVYRPAATSR